MMVEVIPMVFLRNRALAFGISTIGCACGPIFWSWVTDALIHEYGWRGALLITGTETPET